MKVSARTSSRVRSKLPHRQSAVLWSRILRISIACFNSIIHLPVVDESLLVAFLTHVFTLYELTSYVVRVDKLVMRILLTGMAWSIHLTLRILALLLSI